jgi:DNA-binding NtrC family response regulator
MLIRILVATQDEVLRERLETLVRARPDVLVAGDEGSRLWERLSRESFDLVVLDAPLLAGSDQGIQSLRRLPDRPEVVVLVGAAEPAERALHQAAGAFATLDQRLPDEVLGEILGTLLRRRREAAMTRLRSEAQAGPQRLATWTSRSPAMRDLVDLAWRVAPTDSSILLLGETGVGKEWLARAIHAEGPRAAAPFIAVNCAALPETLLESELFGHEKGAFTGAIRSRRGHFELAHRGTLFLDEIGDMPTHLQAKLLRALQERRIQRLGGETAIEVDVRIIAATNRDLQEAMAEKSFRRDLFYRLGVVSLTIPPLRDHREDVAELVQQYVEIHRLRLGRAPMAIAPDALQALTEYPWPGNVRELLNVLERAVLLARDATIRPADLPPGFGGSTGGSASPQATGPTTPTDDDPLWALPLAEARARIVEAFERRYLARRLEETGGRIGAAAARAGVDPRTLYNKMREYRVRKEDFRR